MTAIINCEACWRSGRFPYHDEGPCPPDQPMAGPSDADRIEQAAFERGRAAERARILGEDPNKTATKEIVAAEVEYRLRAEIADLKRRLALCVADEPTGVYREGYERARAETIAQVVAFLRSRCRHDAAADVERFEEERLKSARVPEPIMAEIRALAAKEAAR